MSKIKIGGTWKNVDTLYTKVAGHWKQVSETYVKVQGHWVGGTLPDGVFHFKSTNPSQTFKFKAPAGESLTLNGVEYLGKDNTLVTITSSDSNLEFKESTPGMLTDFQCYRNGLTGNLPNLAIETKLVDFLAFENKLTGSIPSLSTNTELKIYGVQKNELTGNIPDLSANTKLAYFYCSFNELSGNIPDISNNTKLRRFYCNDNKLTGFDGGSIKVGEYFLANNNQLTQRAVDDILAALVSGGTTNAHINLGGGNAAPSAAGKSSIDSLRAANNEVSVTGGY